MAAAAWSSPESTRRRARAIRRGPNPRTIRAHCHPPAPRHPAAALARRGGAVIAYRFGAGGPGPRPLRDLAAVRDRGQPRRPARPGPPRDARAVGRRGPRAARRARPLPARGRRAGSGLPAGLRLRPPERPRAGFASELARVRATPPAQVARDLGWAYEGARRRPPRACCSTTRRAGWPTDRADDRLLAAGDRPTGRRSAPRSRPTSPTAPAGSPKAARSPPSPTSTRRRAGATARSSSTARTSPPWSSPAGGCCSSRSRSPGRSCGR